MMTTAKSCYLSFFIFYFFIDVRAIMCCSCCSNHHEGHIWNNAYWSEPVLKRQCACRVMNWSLHHALVHWSWMNGRNTNHFWYVSANCPALLPMLWHKACWQPCRNKFSAGGTQGTGLPRHCLCPAFTVLGIRSPTVRCKVMWADLNSKTWKLPSIPVFLLI